MKIQIAKNKTMATLIALILMLSISSTIVTLPAADAHTPAWKIPTWCYVQPAPETVGLGQSMTFVWWLTFTQPGSYETNPIRYQGFTLKVTAPNGDTETLGPFKSDTTGGGYTPYTPDQIGKYNVTVYFPEQVYTWGPETPQVSAAYQNDTWLVSNSNTFTVQQEPVKMEFNYPLPTEFWTRPIEGQNNDWYLVASNWLSGSSCVTPSGVQDDYYQKDGIAPNSAHIMWVKPLEDGGVVGGTNTALNGNVFYSGTQYNPRFDNTIIMNGRVIYELPYGNSGGGGGYQAVDLVTGEKLWWSNTTGVGVPSFGYLYAYEHYNQHGVIPQGWLFTSNFARSYDPRTGIPTTLNITNVPSGTEILGPAGEALRYTIANIGNTTVPNWRLTQWNSSKVFVAQNSGFLNASLASRYDWNVSITGFGLGMTSPSIQAVEYNDVLLGRNGTLPSTVNQSPGITYWALSLKPESKGNLLWMKYIAAPPNNMTLMSESAAEGVFILTYKEIMQWLGYDMHTGDLLWQTPSEPTAFGYFSWTTGGSNTNSIADGTFYSSGYSGSVYAYDLNNGTLKWTYVAEMSSAIFARQNLQILAIADNKMYLGCHEHSASTPLFKDVYVRCIDLSTGNELWKMMGWGAAYSGSVADGYLVYLNLYDQQIYCIGKGPSATTVEASPKVSVNGDSVLITGTVTDQSPGAKAKGTAAVSDESMSQWMEYQYMQKPKPTNTTGVAVTLEAIDPNGNFIKIGSTTSDMNGMYSLMWTPEVPGKYTITATFAGTESYWRSSGETAIGVSEAPATPTPPPAPAQSPPYEMYTIGTGVAIIIAVALVGLLLLRKRP